MKKLSWIQIVLNLLFIAVALILVGCTKQGTQKSYIATLDEVDALIKQKQFDAAMAALDSLDKESTNKIGGSLLNSWTILGVYRRYNTLGALDKAQKILKKGLDSNKGNVEISAVYANYLLQEAAYFGNIHDEMVYNEKKSDDFLQEAIKVAKCLQGTKYGSLYSEALLKDNVKKLNDSLDGGLGTYLSKEYLPIYMDAYLTSHNSDYLQNAALIHLSNGRYEDAFNIRPPESCNARDAYFWAKVAFDNKCYGDAVTFLEEARVFQKDAHNNGEANTSEDKTFDVKVLSLEADSYTALREEDEAQKLRKSFISSLEYRDGEWVLPYDEKDSNNDSMFSAIFVNAARFAFDNDDWDSCASYITFAVNKWQDFVAALSLYSNFAYVSNLARKETLIQRQIRNAKLSTLEMEEYDRRPKIPMSDALYRIEQSRERTHNPLLYVLALDMKYKIDESLTVDDKERDIWKTLEENITPAGTYPIELFDYAVNFMLKNKKRADAWFLYRSTLHKMYDIPFVATNVKKHSSKNMNAALQEAASFLDAIQDKAPFIEQNLLEYAAYFAAGFALRKESRALYETVCEDGLRTTNYTLINMALIYSSIGERDKAIDILEKTVGRCTNMKQKSLVMYRIALLYYKAGNIKNAKRAAEYSITLNDRNADARLLLSRMTESGK